MRGTNKFVPTMISILALGGILAPAGSAKPAHGPGCAKGALCFWAKPNYKGKKVVIDHGGVSNKLAKRMNNRASSLKVRSESTIFFYDKRNAKGDARCAFAGGNVPDLSGPYDFDNRASSSRISKGGTPCF